MKANKRIRDLRRKSARRLYVLSGDVKAGTTTYPTLENRVQAEARK
jgi:hypothetical protein